MTIPVLEVFLWWLTWVCFFSILAFEIVTRYRAFRRRRRIEKDLSLAVAQEVKAVRAEMERQTSAPAPTAAGPKKPEEGSAAAVDTDPLPIKRLRLRAVERQDRRIGEILLANQFITREELDKALEHQKKYGGSITQHLLHFGCIDEKQLAQCLSSQFKVPYLPLESYEISDEIVQAIPVDIAEKYWVMPVDRQGDSLMVAMIDPLDTDVIKELEKLTGLEIIPFVGIISEIVSALRLYYKILSKDKTSQLMKSPPFFIDTKTYTGVERRRAIRYRAKIDIRFPLHGRYITSQTVDISRGGFAFVADEPIELGTVFTLEINLPREVSPLPISAVTQVVRSIPLEGKGFHLGVKTLKISQQENNLILTYASKHRDND